MLDAARAVAEAIGAERIELLAGRHHRPPPRARAPTTTSACGPRPGASSTSPRSTTSRCRSRSPSGSTSTAPATCSTSASPARASSGSPTSAPPTSPGGARGSSTSTSWSWARQFKNHYESTKFQAEVWVRDAPRPGADDDPAAGDRGRRLAHRRDREVRRPVLHPPRALPRRANGPGDAAVRPLARRRSTSSRSTTWSPRWSRPPATRRRSARRCTSSTPTR